MPKAAWCLLRGMPGILRLISHRVWRASNPVWKQKQRNSPIFLSCCLKASHQPHSCLLETAPGNVFWLTQCFSKVAENSLLTLLSFVVLCLTLLVLYRELVGLLCTTAKPSCIQSCSWPAQRLWIKLHEIGAQQLETRFEEFLKIQYRITWSSCITMFIRNHWDRWLLIRMRGSEMKIWYPFFLRKQTFILFFQCHQPVVKRKVRERHLHCPFKRFSHLPLKYLSPITCRDWTGE